MQAISAVLKCLLQAMPAGSRRESVLREAFKDLLKAWGRQHDLVFVPERVVDRLARVTRVSVETMRIVGEIEAAAR